MNLTGRRALLRIAAGCALAPTLMTRTVAHEVGGVVFEPPLEPLLYTRRLVRELGGGLRLAVTRSFSVRFSPLPAGGYQVGGKQLTVEVAAPDKMAPFAELERGRVETGVFPLQLDIRGMITRGPGLASSHRLEQAVAEARRMIEERAVPTAERGEAEAFVQLVHQAGAGLAAYLPEDLFAPASHSRTERRAIDLPGSGGGEIEVTFTADADPQSGLMSRARRDIVTTIGGDRRITQEEWALAFA